MEQVLLAGTGRRRAPKAAGSPERLAPGLCLPRAQGRETEERGKTALLRPHLNAVSFKAFFLSSEGTGQNCGSNQHNVMLCTTVNSLGLEKSVRQVCLCVKHARIQRH